MQEHPLMMERAETASGRQVSTMVMGGTPMPATITGRSPLRTTTQTVTIKHLSGTMATNRAVRMVQVTKATSQEGVTPGSMKLGLVVNVTQSAQSYLILSTQRRRLHLCQPHQKT